MISIVTRTTIMFFLVMFALRVMGKKNLGEFQPSDFVSTMLGKSMAVQWISPQVQSKVRLWLYGLVVIAKPRS